MKEKIFELKEQGKTYNEIAKILNCSKGTISYHLGKGQKEKTQLRTKKNRKKNPLLQKVDNFKYDSKNKRNFVETVRKFQKRDNNSKGKINSTINQSFNWEDVVNKFGAETNCYLSGEPINLFENTYSLDHIIPSSKGGENTLENLGITHKTVNNMKTNLSVDEFLFWCKKILEHNGYVVTK
jgi:5-methylcytosine-specific restriction endonuclease McrA